MSSELHQPAKLGIRAPDTAEPRLVGTSGGKGALRGLLMGSAAMAALLLAPSRGAYAACTGNSPTPGTITCEGDVNAGINLPDSTYESLIVQNVQTNITPADGTAGILFTHSTDVGITADIDLAGDVLDGRFDIITQNADGIDISAASTSPVTVHFNGDITATDGSSSSGDILGLNVSGNGPVSVTSTGNVSVTTADLTGSDSGPSAVGIRAQSTDNSTETVTLNSTGDITAQSGSVTRPGGGATSGSATGVYASGPSAHAVSHGTVLVSSGDATGGPDAGIKYTALVGNAAGVGAGASVGEARIESSGDVSVSSGDAGFNDVVGAAKYYATVGQTVGLMATSSTGSIDIESDSHITVSSGNASVIGGAAAFSGGNGGGNQAEVDLTAGIYAGSDGGNILVHSEGDLDVSSGDATSTSGSGAVLSGYYAARVYGTSGIYAVGTGAALVVQNTGNMTVESGDATATSTGIAALLVATVGTAAGINAAESGGSVQVENGGNLAVTAGTATTTAATYSGLAYGIVGKTTANEAATPVFPGGSVTITSSGDIDVTGGPVGNPYGASNPLTTSAGIMAAAYASSANAVPAGETSITVDGGAITTHGATVVGTASYGSVNHVVVKNGGSVTANGAGATGVVVGGQLYASVAGGAVDSVASSVNTVRVGKNSSVVSTSGTAILDKETVTFPGPAIVVPPPILSAAPVGAEAAIGVLDPATNLIIATAANQTTVHVAGTVSGAVAAISLGGGDDSVVMEPGHNVTGLVDGGSGGETNGDTLDLGGSGDGVFDISTVDADGNLDANDQYTNFENYAKIGPSSFKVTGTNTEIATLPLLGGSLFVNGALPNTFIPMSSGTLLGGNGTVGSFTAAGGSTVAPGNSIDTLTVAGNATFADNSTFQVEIAPDLTHDLLDVKGTLTIDGGTIKVLAQAGAYPDAARFTIARAAGGRTGKFDTVTDDLPDIDLKATYPGNRVVLSFAPAGNKKDNSNKANGPTAAIAAGFGALNFAETLQERGHFMVGHVVPDMAPMNYVESPKVGTEAFKAVASASGPATSSDPVYFAAAPTAPHEGVGFWIGGLADDQDYDDFDSHSAGIAGGVEAIISDADSVNHLGLALGYTDTDASVKNGSADSNGFHVGIYGARQQGPWNLAAAIAYSNFDYDLSRTISIGAGGTATAKGDADGDAFSASLQAAYDLAPRFGWSNVSFAPTARLNALSADRDAYKETGAGVLDLQVDKAEFDQVLPAIGLSLGTTYQVGEFLLKPEVQVFYEHMFGDDDVTSTSHIALAGADFSTTVSAGARDRIGLGAGLGMSFSDRVSASLRYDGSFGNDTQQHRASGALNVKF